MNIYVYIYRVSKNFHKKTEPKPLILRVRNEKYYKVTLAMSKEIVVIYSGEGYMRLRVAMASA